MKFMANGHLGLGLFGCRPFEPSTILSQCNVSYVLSIIFPSQSYYILLEPGVARGKDEFCGSESAAVRDPTIWTFSVSK